MIYYVNNTFKVQYLPILKSRCSAGGRTLRMSAQWSNRCQQYRSIHRWGDSQRCIWRWLHCTACSLQWYVRHLLAFLYCHYLEKFKMHQKFKLTDTLSILSYIKKLLKVLFCKLNHHNTGTNLTTIRNSINTHCKSILPGVQHEEGIFRVHPHWGAFGAHVTQGFMPPHVHLWIPRHLKSEALVSDQKKIMDDMFEKFNYMYYSLLLLLTNMSYWSNVLGYFSDLSKRYFSGAKYQFNESLSRHG